MAILVYTIEKVMERKKVLGIESPAFLKARTGSDCIKNMLFTKLTFSFLLILLYEFYAISTTCLFARGEWRGFTLFHTVSCTFILCSEKCGFHVRKEKE